LTGDRAGGEYRGGRRRSGSDDDDHIRPSEARTSSKGQGEDSAVSDTRNGAESTDEQLREEFESCAEVAEYIFQQMPRDLPPPTKISVERVTNEVYAVRVFERDEVSEAFFCVRNEDSPY